MSRLNTPTYLHHHCQLKELWLVDQPAFLYLSPRDQLDLHKYFQFASDKTEAELLKHRRNVHSLDPSLPQRAGRAYARLCRGERTPVDRAAKASDSPLLVRVLMRPEPNLRQYAKALLYMSLDQVERRMRRERLLNRFAVRATRTQWRAE